MSVTSKLTVIGAAGGQSGPEYWASRIERTTNDDIFFLGVCCDSADNIIAVGHRDYSNPKGFIIKYDKFGDVQWQVELDVGVTAQCLKVATDSNDNIYVTAGGFYSNYNRSFLLKYDAAGNFQWSRSYSNNQFYVFRNVDVDDNDYIYVSGSDASSRCMWAKYDASGTLQNSKSLYNGTLYSESFRQGVVVPSTGEWIQAGNTSQSGVDSDGTMVKINSSGGISFRKRYFGTNTQICYSAGAKSDGSAFYTFIFDLNGGPTTYYRIVKLNSSGSLVRSVYTAEPYTGDMAVDSNTRVLIAGSTGFISCDEYLNAGSTFSRSFSGFNPNAIAVDSNNNIIFAGKTGASAFRADEGAVIKLPADGSGTGTWDWLTYSTGTGGISGTVGVSNTSTTAYMNTPNGSFSSIDPFTKTDPAYTTELYEIEP